MLQAVRQAAQAVLRREQVTVVPPDFFYDAMVAFGPSSVASAGIPYPLPWVVLLPCM